VKVSGAKALAQRLIVAAVANVDKERAPMRFNRVRERSRAALVDPAGRFDITVTPGRYDIRAFHVYSCIQVFKLDETLEVAAGAKIQKELSITAQLVRLKLKPLGDQPMAHVSQLRIRSKPQWGRDGVSYDPRHYLTISNIHSGVPLQPGQTSIELLAQPGEYQIEAMDRAAFLRNATSFQQVPVGKQDIEVSEHQQNEFTIAIQPPPSTAELEAEPDNDK